jgi:hypothetical protein
LACSVHLTSIVGNFPKKFSILLPCKQFLTSAPSAWSSGVIPTSGEWSSWDVRSKPASRVNTLG